MLKRIVNWFKRRSAPTEDSTEYDGVLSYSGEWHALIIGLMGGVASVLLNQPMIAGAILAVALGVQGSSKLGKKYLSGRYILHEVKREGWYAGGGTLIGWVGATLLTSL